MMVMVTTRSPFQFLNWGQNHLHNWKLGRVTLMMVMVVMLLVVRAIHYHRAGGNSTRPAGTV
jgi:hypothetical protein